jgi:hypothetical protein
MSEHTIIRTEEHATTLAAKRLLRRNRRFGMFSVLVAVLMGTVFVATAPGDTATFVLTDVRGQLFALPNLRLTVTPTLLVLTGIVLAIAYRQFTAGFGKRSVLVVGIVAGLFVLGFLTWAAADGNLSVISLLRGTVARATPIALGALAGVMCDIRHREEHGEGGLLVRQRVGLLGALHRSRRIHRKGRGPHRRGCRRQGVADRRGSRAAGGRSRSVPCRLLTPSVGVSLELERCVSGLASMGRARPLACIWRIPPEGSAPALEEYPWRTRVTSSTGRTVVPYAATGTPRNSMQPTRSSSSSAATARLPSRCRRAVLTRFVSR